MNFRVRFHTFLLPAACLSLLTTPVHAANPLKALGTGLKKVSGNLNPFKKPKAVPVEIPTAKPAVAKAKAPAAKPVAKTTNAAKGAPSAKPAKGQTLASAKPKARAGKPVAPTAKTAAAVGAAGAAGPEKPTDPAKEESPAHETASTSILPEPTLATPPADIPFATPVMGRKGHVRSPFAEDQGMVDVSDIPAGTKVRCPYTGKVFRVP